MLSVNRMVGIAGAAGPHARARRGIAAWPLSARISNVVDLNLAVRSGLRVGGVDDVQNRIDFREVGPRGDGRSKGPKIVERAIDRASHRVQIHGSTPSFAFPTGCAKLNG